MGNSLNGCAILLRSRVTGLSGGCLSGCIQLTALRSGYGENLSFQPLQKLCAPVLAGEHFLMPGCGGKPQPGGLASRLMNAIAMGTGHDEVCAAVRDQHGDGRTLGQVMLGTGRVADGPG